MDTNYATISSYSPAASPTYTNYEKDALETETETRLAALLKDEDTTDFKNGRVSKVAADDEISNMRILAKFGIPYSESTAAGILFAADIYDTIGDIGKELGDKTLGSRCTFYCEVKDKNDPDSKILSTGFDYEIYSGTNKTELVVHFNTKKKHVTVEGMKQKPLGSGGDDPMILMFSDEIPVDKKKLGEAIPFIVEKAKAILPVGITSAKKDVAVNIADVL